VRWNEVMHVETDRSRSDGFGSTSASCGAVRHGAIVATSEWAHHAMDQPGTHVGNPTARIMATVQIFLTSAFAGLLRSHAVTPSPTRLSAKQR
jgi:hypothetical protein